VAQTSVGKKAVVKFIRDKAPRTVEVTIAEQPKTVAQAGGEEGGESVRPSGLLSDLDVRELTAELVGRFGLAAGERGVIIARVRSGSIAEEAGIKEGDIVLEVNRKPVPNLKAYEKVASRIGKDETVLLLIKRQGRTIFVTLKP
jgi:serine protease Do